MTSLPQETLADAPQPYPLPPELVGKRVLVFSESLGPLNGVTRATQYLLEYLVERGVEVAAVAPDFEKPERSPLRTKLPLIRLAGLPLLYNPDLRIAAPFRISKIFQRTFKPDVIYLASPASLALLAWLQLREAGIPLVANYQTDLGFYARLILPKPFNQGVGWTFDRLTGWAYQHKAFKTIFCPSSSSLHYLQSIGVPTSKLQLVGRGVDTSFFNRVNRNEALRQKLAPNGEILLLCVSRVSLEKGFEFLAQAYDKISGILAASSQKARLIITGGNSNKSIEQTIKGYFSSRHLDVHFTGPLTGQPLAEIYASADVFIFPSVTETFGQVLQEAMASGLPVVARAEGGPIDVVDEGVTGYLVAPDDVEAFARRTAELVTNAELRRTMAETAYQLAQTKSWDAINQRIATVLGVSTQKPG